MAARAMRLREDISKVAAGVIMDVLLGAGPVVEEEGGMQALLRVLCDHDLEKADVEPCVLQRFEEGEVMTMQRIHCIVR